MSQDQREIASALHEHLRRLSIKHPNENRDGFDNEINELRIVDHRVKSNVDEFYTSSLATNMAKNRFYEVHANEGTLVRINPLTEKGNEIYINANFIDGRELFKVPFTYIATQAPLKNTIIDFWRMVYENNVTFIIMLCGEIENGKVKSEVYWPKKGEEMDFGVLKIKLKNKNQLFDLIFRTFLIRNAQGEEREVFHIQYIGWPDQSIPETSASLMEIIQNMGNSKFSVQNPILVHCSGGIGRTGVFIALHITLAQFQLQRKDINIQKIVHNLRLCRSGMVQRKDQYVFLYYSILREMDRMILSAEKGINLLKLRHRESTSKKITQNGNQPLYLSNTIFSQVLLPPPPPLISKTETGITGRVKEYSLIHGINGYTNFNNKNTLENGRVPKESFLYSQSSRTPITEVERQVLERYLERQESSSSSPLLYQKINHNEFSSKSREKSVRIDNSATKDNNKEGLNFESYDKASLEEQLKHWQFRNKKMRFSTEERDNENLQEQNSKNNTTNNINTNKEIEKRQTLKTDDFNREKNEINSVEKEEMKNVQQQEPKRENQQEQFPARTTSVISVRSVPPVSIIITPQEATARDSNPTTQADTGPSPTYHSHILGYNNSEDGHPTPLASRGGSETAEGRKKNGPPAAETGTTTTENNSENGFGGASRTGSSEGGGALGASAGKFVTAEEFERL